MRSQANTMFVGLKTNERLRDQLDSSKNSVKPFFRDNNPEFLQIMQIDENEYIGKVMENGVSLESINNIFMNVKTMIRMICPTYSFADDAIKCLVLTATPSRNY
jgi:hypothetical protein